MRKHTGAGHEALLAEVLAGAEDARASAAGSSLGDCPACKDLLALRARMDDLGTSERAEISAALASRTPPRGRADENVRAEILAALAAAPSSPARGTLPARRTAWIAAAAVLVALLAVWTWMQRAAPSEADPKLGPPLELLHPLGRVDDFGAFRWSAAGPTAGWYRVVVQPLEDGGTRAPTDSGRILGTSWEPSPEVRKSWGDRIRWTLEVYRAGPSDLVDSKSASAELSSH